MSWLNSFTPDDIREMIADACDAFYNMRITEDECRKQLGKLGLNATDIEERIEENRP